MPRKRVMRAELIRKRQTLLKSKLFATITNDIQMALGRELTEAAVRSIAADIKREWEALAREKLAVSPNPHRQANPAHIPRYIAGMGDVKVEGNRIRLHLRSFDAVRLEYGWAPPETPGARLEDGLGKYDGRPHDMRPLLLYGGKAPVQTKRAGFGKKGGWTDGGKWKKSTENRGVWEKGARNTFDTAPRGRTGATLMKVIKLELDEMSLTDLSRDVLSWMEDQTNYFAERRIAKQERSEEEIAEIRGQAMRRTERQKEIWRNAVDQVVADINKRLPLREGWDSPEYPWAYDKKRNVWRRRYDPTTPATMQFDDPNKALQRSEKILWSEKMNKPITIKHKNFLYHNMRVEPAPGHGDQVDKGSRYQMFTLRTISDSPKQIRKKRWFSVGNPPAHIIAGDPRGNDLVHRISALVGRRGLHKAIKERLAKPTRVDETINIKEENLKEVMRQVPGIVDLRAKAESLAQSGASVREIRRAMGPDGLAQLRQSFSQAPPPAVASPAAQQTQLTPANPATPAAMKARKSGGGPSAADMAMAERLEAAAMRPKTAVNQFSDKDINPFFENDSVKRKNYDKDWE